jgi:hypothetical protein
MEADLQIEDEEASERVLPHLADPRHGAEAGDEQAHAGVGNRGVPNQEQPWLVFSLLIFIVHIYYRNS